MLMMMMVTAAATNKKQQLVSNLTRSSSGSPLAKGSNSSNETVIARIEPETGSSMVARSTNLEAQKEELLKRYKDSNKKTTSEEEFGNKMTKIESESVDKENNNKQRTNGKILKTILMLTAHLNPFNQSSGSSGKQQQQQRKCSVADLIAQDVDVSGSNDEHEDEEEKVKQRSSNHSTFQLNLLNFAHRYFGMRQHNNGGDLRAPSKSAPATPLKWSNGLQSPPESATSKRTVLEVRGQLEDLSRFGCSLQRPSVRFVDKAEKRIVFTDCGSQTTNELESANLSEEEDEVNVVEKLFKLPSQADDGAGDETPMNSSKFRQYGYSLIEYISNYLDTIDKRRVTPLNIEPGYLKSLIEPNAPEKGETFAQIMHDFENHIMCGITHWQHPHFHAYFPAGNAYPSILADMLSDALGCVGFSWAASPAYTELEIIMLDWMGKMIGLPDEFLCLSHGNRGGSSSSSSETSKGGGVIQGSASECVLVNLLAARHWAIDKLRKKYPNTDDGILLSKLIGYCSKEAHSCVEKAAMIGFIRMRALDTDDKHSLRGETLAKAISQDLAQGFEPFFVCATLGTTSCVSFDNLEELGRVCAEHDIWLHVDAAYAGSAFICPEFKYLMKGIEMATSFNMNPNKWLLINFDCSLMWVKDRFKLTRAFVVDPLYLQHSFSDQAIDYRHWGIPLSRRFRALKLWFVIRNYGIHGLQKYIRNHVKLAKLFEQLILNDSRFSINNQVVLGLVCFRLIGSNALNQRLLSMINASGKLHMVPASLNGRYVIRFCICEQNAKEEDVHYAYKCISDFASELLESIRAGRERIRAVSQQNTIDISNISLHTQQSASTDRLNNSSESMLEQQVAVAGAAPAATPVFPKQLAQTTTVSQRDAARQYLLAGSPRALEDGTTAVKGPLTKQVSIAGAGATPQAQLQQALAGSNNGEAEEDLEQDVKLDSLTTFDGFDDDLMDDELLEPPFFPQDSADAHDESGSQAAPRAPCRNHAEQEEAADEVYNLTKRRNRMSLRYKREFFVRVVSDPRVYRASISGDINARASTSSLSGAGAGAVAGAGTGTAPLQQQSNSSTAPQSNQTIHSTSLTSSTGASDQTTT